MSLGAVRGFPFAFSLVEHSNSNVAPPTYLRTASRTGDESIVC